jgi:hypothetical protein
MNTSRENISQMSFEQQMQYLRNFAIYRDIEEWVEHHNVWARPIRPQSFKYADFENTNLENKFNYAAFTMSRTLTAMYELDFMYLPESSENIVEQLQQVYNPELRQVAAQLIPELEKRSLGFLQDEVKVSDKWTRGDFLEYFRSKVASVDAMPASFDLIREHKDNKELINMLLMQHAVDFLPESSHMARFVKGDFGALQSAIFRVMIDEFGYGNHETKHSTLFKKTLSSVGMQDNSHAYWMFYLNSTLLTNNYFHMLTRSPEKFFQYLGAIAYAENTFGPYCRRTKDLLRDCYGEQVDTRYYSEHDHIDGHHGRMTVDEIILPAIEKFGPSIIPEIVRGVESVAKLQEIGEEDFYNQIEWMSKRPLYRKLAQDIKQNVLADIANIPVALLNEPFNELSVAHVHDGDEFCIVDEGVLRFCHGPDCFSDLQAGECVVIKKNRLHGALVISENCKYRILSIGDYTKYANYQV